MTKFLEQGYKKNLTEIFIGKKINVLCSGDSTKIGLKGIVQDETKNMFCIKTKKGIKKIPKEDNIFEIEIEGKMIEIKGKDICYILADRIKKYC